MFTGIVEESGVVIDVTADEGGRRLTIAGDEVTADLAPGQSVAVSGVCLTVERSGRVADRGIDPAAVPGDADVGPTCFEVFLAAETVEQTYLGEVEVGHVVNLERAMPADGRLDGHVVQGHVDTTTELTAVESVGEDWRYTFAVPPGYGKYIARKGSIALDGVSLTVASRDPDTFDVAIIPTTRELTNFSEKAPGDPVHVEIDVLARYAERLLADRERAGVALGEDAGEAGAGLEAVADLDG